MTLPKGNILKSIETPRLIMRHHTHDDFDAYVEVEQHSAKELSPWFGWINSEQGYNNRAEIKKYFSYLDELNSNDNPKQLHFFIFEKQSNQFIGTLLFFRVDWDIPYFYLAYWLDTRKSGNGYMTEATNALSRFCFRVYGAKRIQISASVKNQKSLNVPRRLHFTLEGELKNYSMHLVTQEVTNSLMYACLSPDTLPPLECHWEIQEGHQ